jgi:hypothetical protein
MLPINMIFNNNGIKNNNDFKHQRLIEVFKATITMISKEMIEAHFKTTTTAIATLILISTTIKTSI